MKILITVKEKYGNELLYPLNDTAKLICTLLGTKTIAKDKVKPLEDLGYRVTMSYEQSLEFDHLVAGFPFIRSNRRYYTMRIFFIVILSTLGFIILNHLSKYGFPPNATTFIKISMLVPLVGCFWMVFAFLLSIMHDKG